MKIMLNNVRLAYTQNLFEPGTFGADGGGSPAYSVTAIFAKDSAAHKQLLDAEEAVAREKWAAKADQILKTLRANGRGPKSPVLLKDGDTKADSMGFEGNSFVSCRRQEKDGRPTIIDSNRAPLQPKDGKPYGGCYANVQIDVWVQDNSYGKRINAQLLGVQFVRDGDSFGGGSAPAAADDFPELDASDDAPADLG